MMKRFFIITAILSLTLLLSGHDVFSEDGVTDNEIILGQSAALTGQSADLGLGMRAGLMACFAKVNAEGGINGRQIRLISKDDSYEPDKAIKNTRELIDQDGVFVLIGEVGTPTSKPVAFIAEMAKIPFVGPFTGAEFLRNTHNLKYTINIRASYYQEMERLAAYIVEQKGLKKVACFYQNDEYGKAGLDGLKIALKKRSIELISSGTYQRNTVDVGPGVSQIRGANPQAIVMVGAYKPCAEFIRMAKNLGMKDVLYANISFVGTQSLLNELGEFGEGCIISQVVNLSVDEHYTPLEKEYIEAMKQFQPDEKIGFISLEGYMVGKLFCMAAREMGKDLTRKGFIDTIERVRNFDLGGPILRFGPDDHQGMDEVYLTIINGKTIKPI